MSRSTIRSARVQRITNIFDDFENCIIVMCHSNLESYCMHNKLTPYVALVTCLLCPGSNFYDKRIGRVGYLNLLYPIIMKLYGYYYKDSKKYLGMLIE